MKKIYSYTTMLCLSLLFVNCKSDKKSQDFKAITDSYFKEKNELNPLDATQSDQHEYDDQLVFEMTDSYCKKKTLFYKKYMLELKSVDTTQLSEEEKNSYEIIKWESEVGTELLQQNGNLTPIEQFDGTHITMGQFASAESAQPFKTVKDYKKFLKRMNLYAVWIDSAMVYMKKGVAKKVVLPKVLAEKVIPQFEDMITPNAEGNLFFSSCKKFPSNFTEEEKNALSKDYATSITKTLIPQFQKLVNYMKTEYVPACRSTSGIGNLPGGNNLYKVLVKKWTTTSKNPAEIHELGLKEVALLNSEMEKVKNEVGFKGTLKEFLNDVRTKKELRPFTDPKQVTDNFERIYKTIKPNVDKLFSLQPKTPFRIKRTEAFREKTASAEYMQGSADGSRPGTFYVPIPDVKNYNVLEDEDLFLHEAIPGHHFQISLQQESKTLPDFRKFNWFGAYGEGWALYCESLGKELGLYKDPYQYLGMLNDEMHRAIRLVVDTGIHSKGWSREQAIKYSLDNEAETEASITSEIERYMAIPGQALSYKIGQLKILELRQKAKDKMKDKFDIKVFHQKVLESGVLPLELLEKKINNWIATVK